MYTFELLISLFSLSPDCGCLFNWFGAGSLDQNDIFPIFTSFRKYKLPMSHIIPFPKRNDPSSAQEFPAGKHVLAVYPSTTALYKATVVQARKVNSAYVVFISPVHCVHFTIAAWLPINLVLTSLFTTCMGFGVFCCWLIFREKLTSK